MNPLNQQEAAYLQHLMARGQANGQVRLPQGPGPQATLYPPDRYSQALLAQNEGAGNPRMDLSRPMPRIPDAEQVGLILSDATISFTSVAVANTSSTNRIGFDSPAIAYALVGGVLDGTNDFPVGQDPNNLYRIQFQTVGTAWLYQSVPTLGGNIVGNARFPRLLTGPAWAFTTGSVLQITVTPLVADLDAIDITLYLIREIGPTNVAG